MERLLELPSRRVGPGRFTHRPPWGDISRAGRSGYSSTHGVRTGRRLRKWPWPASRGGRPGDRRAAG